MARAFHPLSSILRLPLLLAVLSTGGCEIVGTVMHRTVGDPPIKAQYVPKEVPTLIYVDNRGNPDTGRIDGDQIAHIVGDELKADAKMKLVDPDKVVQIREEQPEAYQNMSIQKVGKLTGASQVIYIELREASTDHDQSGGAVHAVATAWVRVVDVDTGRTLWPAQPASGREVGVTKEYDPVATATARSMHASMLQELSSKISKMFYEWKPDNQDQENAGG